MAFRNLIPWNRERELDVHRGFDANPFLSLHREMNRMFDDVFRSLEGPRPGSQTAFGAFDWPRLDIEDAEKEIRITAELPGLEEKDVHLELANGVLSISGERKSETEDKDRRVSERYYGRFERRIPLEDIDEDKISASFAKGVLTVTVPKSNEARAQVRRIAINGKN